MFPFDVVLFDIGGVLLTNGWDHHERSIVIEQFKLDRDTLESRHAKAFEAWERGERSGVFKAELFKVDVTKTPIPRFDLLKFEQYLYVGDWDDKFKVVMRYPVRSDGTLAKGEVFYDMTGAPGDDAIDGIKVDTKGNLYVSGPGGLWILSPEGKHLGTIVPPRHPHNMTWGDSDGRTLYLTAEDRIYRIRLNIPGIRPQPRS